MRKGGCGSIFLIFSGIKILITLPVSQTAKIEKSFIPLYDSPRKEDQATGTFICAILAGIFKNNKNNI